MFKILGTTLLVFSTTFQMAYANDFALPTAKNELVNENINVAISYENYVLVKEQAHAKTMQLLPTLTVDLLVTDYQYTILRSVIPEPSRFFDAFAAKDLAKAASVNREIVKKNLLEDLEKTYFLHQFHKEVVAELKYELSVKAELAERALESYELGSMKFEEYYSIQRELVVAKANLVNATEVVNVDEFALKLILQENNLSEITLANADFYNGTLAFPASVETAMNIAQNNSKEIEQWDHLIAAAKNTKKGVAISWLSWNGIGFDYFAKVSIAKHEVTKLELQRTKTVYELRNQVALAYSNIEKQIEKIAYQTQLTEMANNEYARALEGYNNQLNTVITVKKAELNKLAANRDLRRLNYELELKYLKLKRLIGANMLTNELPQE
jgi:outer membrane protein TolC